jgi:hypothetical protein
MEKEWFETTDFYLTVWLVCNGAFLTSVYKNDSTRNAFVLSGKPHQKFLELSQDFFNGAKISAILYKNVLNDLKTIIRNFEKNGQIEEVKYGKNRKFGRDDDRKFRRDTRIDDKKG